MNTPVYPVRWQNDRVLLIDQNRLPNEYTHVEISLVEDMAEAISTMIVRGAPAIGVAAAYGMYLGAKEITTTDRDKFLAQLVEIGKTLRATRPTAVNLFWAIDRMKRTFQKAKNDGRSVSEIKQVLLEDAKAIHEEDIESQRLIAQFGGELLDDNSTVLTHCNAGALATGGVWGTA